jgi:hypothetical protein
MKMKLNLSDKGGKNSRRVKPWQAIVGVIALVMVPTLGNTFAGSITVNTAQNVEFGQGIASTAACDSAVTITPYAKYVAAQANYYLETITVSNIDFADTSTATDTNCRGKVFKIQVLDSADTLQTWYVTGTTGSAKTDPTQTGTTISDKSSGLTVIQTGPNTETGTVSFKVDSETALLASRVDKILIQTSAN